MNYRSEQLTPEQMERERLADIYQHMELLRALLTIRQKKSRGKR